MERSDITNLAIDFVLAKSIAKQKVEEEKEAHEALIAALTEAGHGKPGYKFAVRCGSETFQLTWVAPQRVSWIAATVKKILPTKLWSRVKVEEVNKAILEAMILSGELAAYDLSEAKEVSASRPYLKVTQRPLKAEVVPIKKTRSGAA